VVEHLPSKHEALKTNSCTEEKNSNVLGGNKVSLREGAGGKRGEMTQTLYAHMNKKKNNKVSLPGAVGSHL
jgi:hypothetical protein